LQPATSCGSSACSTGAVRAWRPGSGCSARPRVAHTERECVVLAPRAAAARARLQETGGELRHAAELIEIQTPAWTIAQARRLSECAICRLPLGTGGSFLFQGDALVHTRCWQGRPRGRRPRSRRASGHIDAKPVLRVPPSAPVAAVWYPPQR